jgi:hypothetical protein
MAELINRMPERLALLDFEMKSEKAKAPNSPPAGQTDSSGRLIASTRPEKPKTLAEAGEKAQKITPPKYDVTITMVGVAPTDLEISRFMTALNTYSLVRQVTLDYSEQKEVQGRTMRQFKIAMILDSEADVRVVDPLVVPRIKNPMSDDVQFNAPMAGVGEHPTTKTAQGGGRGD